MPLNKRDNSLFLELLKISSILRKKLCKTLNHKIFCCILVLLLYYFGGFTHIFELDYETKFNYPLQRNIVDCVHNLARNRVADCDIINSYNYTFTINNGKCATATPIRLVMIVKSAVNNYNRRMAIRNSWGHEERFSDVPLKRLFILGKSGTPALMEDVKREQENFGDIVQADFLDTYYNNTVKTMMAYKWAVHHCSNANFYLFSDDDMYVSVKNVLRFVRNPTQYPDYLRSSEDAKVADFRNKVTQYELPETVKLFSGFVFVAAPHRHQCSKWYVSLDEYPYDKWPPYVGGGAYILSKEALKAMHYASYFTEHFRFDDIYLGLLAKKLDLEPFHHNEFYVFKKPYNRTTFKYVLASHGYQNNELLRIWNEQKSLGNA